MITALPPGAFGQRHDLVGRVAREEPSRRDELDPRIGVETEQNVPQELRPFEPPVAEELGIEGGGDESGPSRSLAVLLEARSHEWISPIIITVSDLSQPMIAPGIQFGRKCLKALGMGTGFTHMEWYRKANGEIVFGEVGCRPGGAHLVDQMNYTSDIDLFREWARSVCWAARICSA